MEQLGPYRCLRPLGAGGMGAVYLGEHAETGARRALKVLPPHLDGEELERFEREALALAAAEGHPGLLRIHALDRSAGRTYMVLELVEGGDLAGRLEQAGPLPPAEALELVSRLCRALARAHAAGVLHRDLKPANVLLTREGEPKLADFGLARLSGAETLTREGEVLGTPVYMAPEQARGEVAAYDERTDVYGLGGILYACLSGRPPVSSQGSVYATLAAVTEEEPTRPSAFQPAVPRWLDEVCLRALAKDPAQRFPDALAFEEALRSAGSRAARRGWLPAAALGALALSGLLALGVARSSGGAPASPSPSADAPSPGLSARAELLASSSAPAPELLAAWEAALASARSAGDSGLARQAELGLLRAATRRAHFERAEALAPALFDDPERGPEARYLLSEALRAQARWEEHERVLAPLLEREGAAWGALARYRLELVRRRRERAGFSQPVRELLEPARLAEGLPAQLAARSLALVRWGANFDPAEAEELLDLPPWRDDALLARELCATLLAGPARPGRGELARRLLERARRLSAPAELPRVEFLAARCLEELGQHEQALEGARQRFVRALLPRERLLLATLQARCLEALDRPEEAFALLGRLAPADREGGEQLLASEPVARRLRFERALGAPIAPARARPVREAGQTLAAWLDALPERARPQAAEVLELAFRGAGWARIEPPLERLLDSQPPSYELQLLAAELALGRQRYPTAGAALSVASRLSGSRLRLRLTLHASHKLSQLVRLPESVARPRDASEATLLAAVRDVQAGRRVEALRRLDQFTSGPAWAQRLRWKLLALLGLEARNGLPLANAYLRLGFSHCEVAFSRELLAATEALRAEPPLADVVASSLTPAIRCLRLLADPRAPLYLAQLVLLSPPALRARFASSLPLWRAEGAAALRGGASSPSAAAAIQRDLRLIEGLQQLHAGAAPEQVEARWAGALERAEFRQLLVRCFRAAYQRDPAR